MENFLGDILSDLGGGTVGGLGMMPSGNIGDHHAYFEPVHGSAPDIAGQDVANPISQVLTAALMLEHLGERDGAELIRRGVVQALESGKVTIVKGRAARGTKAAGEAIAQVIRGLP
jgi:3-isopropylmalate dehydrogenase